MRSGALAFVVSLAAVWVSACSADTTYRLPDSGAARDSEAADEGAPPEGDDAEVPVEDDGVSAVEDAGRDAAIDAAVARDAVVTDAADGGPDAPLAMDAAVVRPDAQSMDAVAPRDAAVLPDVVTPPRDVPTTGTCRERLTALGVSYTVAGATRGIDDPVTVRSPINGVNFRYAMFSAAPGNMLMDCRLGLALDALTRHLRDAWDVTDVVHLGVYNYRCIAGTDPCQLSQHSRALAIDLNSFRNTAGQTFSVTTQFVANGRPTCPARPTNAADTLLKGIACWMYDTRTFAIVLTPNYNEDHRDHFHVDLTEDSHFVGLGRPGGVDPEVAPGVIDSIFDDY